MKRILGPYLRPDGRKHMVIVNEDGSKTTKSYPKYLMEQHLGRELTKSETVDHKDRDFTNDSIENLRVVARKIHCAEDAKRVKQIETSCIWCGKMLFREARKLDYRARKGKAGPFCDRKCSGKYGNAVQNKRIIKLPAQEAYPKDKREYYFKDK